MGRIEQPTGTVTGSIGAERKLSQYKRAEETAFAANQYSITLSADFTRAEGGVVHDVRFTFGIRFCY